MTSDFFIRLTWDDLELWAGPKIVSRGKSYQRSGRVKDLSGTKSGDLVAWVDGSQRYATRASHDGERISSQCTCPYGAGCKHAVAVVLEYLEFVKKGKALSIVSDEDERLELIKSKSENYSKELLDKDDWPDEGEHGDSFVQAGQRETQEIKDFLYKKSKKELIELILATANRHPEIFAELRDASSLSSGSIAKLVKAVSREIDKTSSEPGWWRHWESQGFIPDYSRVLSNLQNLLEAGYADEVLSLGEKLFMAGSSQVGQSDDEGQTASQIADCMKVVFKALQECSLADSKKILWAVDFELRDEYELCYHLDEFWKREFKREDWSAVADQLLDRLSKWKPEAGMDSFSREYRRERLTDTIIWTLEKAGRDIEIIPLAMKEASETHSYERLVRFLRQEGRRDEAAEWIRKGFEATKEKWPGIATQLRQELLEMRRRQRDWKSVAAIRAEEFFESPSLHYFQELQKASEEAGVWDAVRQGAIYFLETGKLPPPFDGSSKPEESPSWPLPKIGLGFKALRIRQRFPLTDVLIEVAIHEKDVDRILKWYDIHTEKRDFYWGGEGSLDDRVAQAIRDWQPDKAVAIWKNLAELHIARTSPSEYIRAAKCLRQIQKVMKKQGRINEWAAYLAKLRVENARKRKFLEILNRISGKPIIET